MMNESELQKRVRLKHAAKGNILWRNNVGVFKDERGIPVRYGLANESSMMNKNIKSSDLIGIEPILITPDMVGNHIGRFIALEVKHPGWNWSGNERELAQLRFHELVRSYYGYATFTTGEQ